MERDVLEKFKAFIGILIVIAVGIFIYISITALPEDGVTSGSEDALVVKHFFEDGTHTVVGTIDLPTPCHTLSTKIAVAESFPEQVTILLTAESNSEICVQVITPQTFIASFVASEKATIGAHVNGKKVLLEIIDVDKKRDLETF